MKSYGVTVQLKFFQQYFHTVPAVLYVVLTTLHGSICFVCSSNFESVDETLYIVLPFKQTISAVLSHGIILKFSM